MKLTTFSPTDCRKISFGLCPRSRECRDLRIVLWVDYCILPRVLCTSTRSCCSQKAISQGRKQSQNKGHLSLSAFPKFHVTKLSRGLTSRPTSSSCSQLLLQPCRRKGPIDFCLVGVKSANIRIRVLQTDSTCFSLPRSTK